jgi:hypothetical protein
MNYAKLMKILDARYYLLEELAGLFLSKTSVLYDIVKKFASTGIFHN